MRLYVTVTGIIFALVVIAHAARMIAEDARLASDPVYLLITACAPGSRSGPVVLRRSPTPGST